MDQTTFGRCLPGRGPPRQGPSGERGRRIRVLIAESDRTTRHELRRVIERDSGFEICAEAADAAERCWPRCANGRHQRARGLAAGGVSATWEIGGRLPRSKVVVLAASAEDGELFAALRAGAQGFLLKTAEFGNVPAALYGVLGARPDHPAFVALPLRHFRFREPRWRRPVGTPARGSRMREKRRCPGTPG